MTPQEELAQYFEVCGYEPTDLISIGTRAGDTGDLHFSVISVADAPRQIAARSRINCWFSANPIRELPPRQSGQATRGTAADVVAIRALWADIDIKPGGMPTRAAAQAVLKQISDLLGVRPVAVVMSGHGFQPRWRLEDPGSPERMTPVIERFGRLVQLVSERNGGKADPVYDLARIIRAPHTMNIKPDTEPVPTKVWLYPLSGSLTLERLEEVLEAYLPETPATPKESSSDPENRHVGLERGNAYTKAAIEAIERELAGIAEWPVGKTDEKGRGWEKIQADAAFRLASLAKAEWNTLELEQAKNLFVVACPKDEKWTVRDVLKKWNSQVKRATAADPPADVDDPLAGGASPLRRAAASSVWDDAAASSDDRQAGQAGGERGVQSRDPGRGAVNGEAGPEAGGDRREHHGLDRPGLEGRPEAGGDRREHHGLDRPGLEGEGNGGVPAEEAPVGEWRKYPWNDFGNADRTIALYGDVLRFSPAMKRWLRYDGGAWRETETGGERCVQDMLRQLWGLEGGLYSDAEYPKGRGRMTSDRNEFAEWLDNQFSAAKVKAAATIIKNDGKLDVAPTVFDTEAMLLNAPNGIIDLYSGELLAHDPALMLRRQIPVKYDPTAKARRWEAFLERVQPSIDMRDYLQRIVGYTMTGRTSEQVVFFHVGKPASGKSVFLRILEAILGEFSRVVPPTTLLNKKMEQHPTDVMGMEGRRMLQVSETPEGARLDEALVKRLSGEETITARGMGENFRDFKIVGKVHLVSNHNPRLSDDPAVHRRLHYIRWDNPVPEVERDPMLAERIIAEELEGVLAWAVRGTRRWVEDRLARPVEAEMARAAYLAEEDEFSQFMQDELIIGADNVFTPTTEIRHRYVEWSRERGFNAERISVHAITKRMLERSVKDKRTASARGFVCALQPPKWVRMSGQDPLS